MEKRGNLLIVDDDSETLSLLKVQLKGQPFDIFTATTPTEGMKILQRESIQVVLSDLQMPSMDGPMFLSEVKSAHPNVIRLVLSGHSDTNEILAAVNSGHIYSYICKPWKKETLIITILNSLDVHLLSRERDQLLLRSHELNGKLLDLNKNLEEKYKEKTKVLECIKKVHGQLMSEDGVTQNVLLGVLSKIFGESYVIFISRNENIVHFDERKGEDKTKLNDAQIKYLFSGKKITTETISQIGMSEFFVGELNQASFIILHKQHCMNEELESVIFLSIKEYLKNN